MLLAEAGDVCCPLALAPLADAAARAGFVLLCALRVCCGRVLAELPGAAVRVVVDRFGAVPPEPPPVSAREVAGAALPTADAPPAAGAAVLPSAAGEVNGYLRPRMYC
jgi:hypothetical protein